VWGYLFEKKKKNKKKGSFDETMSLSICAVEKKSERCELVRVWGSSTKWDDEKDRRDLWGVM